LRASSLESVGLEASGQRTAHARVESSVIGTSDHFDGAVSIVGREMSGPARFHRVGDSLIGRVDLDLRLADVGALRLDRRFNRRRSDGLRRRID